eukprot:6329989-Heterocapsa_arctica.AAC.1
MWSLSRSLVPRPGRARSARTSGRRPSRCSRSLQLPRVEHSRVLFPKQPGCCRRSGGSHRNLLRVVEVAAVVFSRP